METLEQINTTTTVNKVVKLYAVDKTRLPADIQGMSAKKLGSCWTQNGDIYRPITLEEEKYYLPNILGLLPNDPRFGEKSRLYWIDFSVSIDPDKQYLDLQVGGTIGEDGKFQPTNLNDWLKFKFASGHPRTASTKEEVENKDNTKYGFYIADSDAQRTKLVAEYKLKENANRAFLKLFASSEKAPLDIDKVNFVIDNYKLLKDTESIDLAVDIDGKKMFLYNRKEANPSKFIKIVEDPLVREKSMIHVFLAKGVLQRIGNTIADDQDILGGSEDEAALYLSNPTNSKKVLSLNERAKTIR